MHWQLFNNPTRFPIANACDHSSYRNLYLMWGGAYGTTRVFVWANSFEDAFEEFVEWADDHAPGLLTKLDTSDLKSSARDLGIPWQSSWPDYEDDDFVRVLENAEADLTLIGHTTLKHGQYIPSWEWGGDDVSGSEEYDNVKRRSIMECSGGSWKGRKGRR